MSNGDDGADDADTESEEGADETPARDPGERLDEAEAQLEEAETEADLDAVEATLDDIESDLPEEPEDDEEEDEEIEELRSRLGDLRDDIEDKRGPYAEDVADEIESAESTLTDSEWTEDGEAEIVVAVDAFLETAEDELSGTFERDGNGPEALAAAVGEVREAVAAAGLDPDDDADTIDTLLGAAETLNDELDDAEVWSDLTVREQLGSQGFYDVLNPENRKDYPAEWNAIKIYEKAYQDGDEEAIEHILTGLERFDSDFMEENVLDTLERIAPPKAFDEVLDLAGSRNQQAIDILGKIGDERALETVHDFVDGGDVSLRKTTLKAIGAIGSEESTQVVANQLADDDAEIRSSAARALGLIGDTRAIDPLADRLEDDPDDTVRASAAWALNRIGTRRAHEAAAEYADDRSYIVQTEAEKALETTGGAA